MNVLRGLSFLLAFLLAVFLGIVATELLLDRGDPEARFEALAERGAHRQAVGPGERALKEAGEAPARAPKDRRALEIALADSYDEAGRLAEACAHYEAVFEELARTQGEAFGPLHLVVGHKLLSVLVRLGDAEAAAGRLHEALVILETGGEDGEDKGAAGARAALFAASFLNGAGPLLSGAGLRLMRPEAASPKAAGRLMALASHYRSHGVHLEAALHLIEAGEAILRTRLGRGDPWAEDAALLLAEAELGAGRFETAAARLDAIGQEGRGRAGFALLRDRLRAEAAARRGEEDLALRIGREVTAALLAAPRPEETVIAPEPQSDIRRAIGPLAPLHPDYRPFDLVTAAAFGLALGKSGDSEEMKLRLALPPGGDPARQSLPARLKGLMAHCEQETSERLSLRSGFRDFATQSMLFGARSAGRGGTAPPGGSEHQSGLAVDINVAGRFMRESDRAYLCFRSEGHRFGFLLSFPPGNRYLGAASRFEPWHWRYVGIEAASLHAALGPYGMPFEFLLARSCFEAAGRARRSAAEASRCLDSLPERASMRQDAG